MFVPEIRFCTEDDIPALLSLNNCSASPWPESVILDDLNPGRDLSYLGAFSRSQTSGLLGLGVLGHEAGMGLLMNLVVAPEFRRRGIGSQILLAVGECAQFMGFSRLKLRVRASNQSALSFYTGLSFSVEKTCRHYYSNGENAFQMSASLPLAFGGESG